METSTPESAPEPEAHQPGTPPESRSRRVPLVWGAIGLLSLVGLLAGAWWLMDRAAEAPSEASVETPSVGDTPERADEPSAELLVVESPAEYTVQAGDTLGEIADRLSTSMLALQVANNLSNPDLVPLGRVLVVPPGPPIAQAVEPARTMRELALMHGFDPTSLAVFNGVDPARVGLPLGREVLLLPDPSRTPPLEEVGSERPLGRTYTVEEGDTILSIAEQLGVDPEVLINDNGLTDADRIRVGDELRIPAAN